MSPARRRLACIVLALTASASSAAADSCRTDARVIGRCFAVRGRASLWNGNPTLRIWRIGTRRMLGVREGAPIPDNLRGAFDSSWNQAFGDFLVCPFTRAQPGRMQIVCVESARRLVVKRQTDAP